MKSTAEQQASPELDAQIATSVMGWIKVESDGTSHWSPSTDPNAAWEVVTQLNKLGWRVLIQIHFDGMHYVDFNRPNAGAGGSAETLSLAVCRAALRTLGHAQ